MADDANVDISVRVRDLTQAGFAQIQDALRLMTEETNKTSEAGGALAAKLRELTPATDSAGSAFAELKSTLSELWENPIQGARDLAGAVMTDLGPALGSAGVAAGLTGAAFVAMGAAAYELASDAADVGESMLDVSMKFGASVPAVSNLSFAAQVAGGSIEQISNAMFLFQRNVGEGSPKIVDGLEKLGLSLDAIKSLNPDEQFLAIASALQEIDDPTQRAAASMELFGRQGRDLLPLMMKPLDELVDKSRELGFTWTEEEAKASEEFEMKTRELRLELSNLAIILGRELIPAVTWFITELETVIPLGLQMIGWGSGLIPIWRGLSEVWRDAAAAIDIIRGTAIAIPKVTGDAKKELDAWNQSVADRANLSLGPNGIVNALTQEKSITTGLMADYETSHKANEQAAKDAAALATAWYNLSTLGTDYRSTLAGMTADTLDLARVYIRAGGSASDVATALHLTAEQVKAVETEWTAYKAVVKEVAKVEDERNAFSMKNLENLGQATQKANKQQMDDTVRSLDATTTLWAEYFDAIDRGTLSTVDYQITQVQRWADAEVAKLKDDDENWMAHYTAIMAVAQQRTENIIAANDPLADAWRGMNTDLRKTWADTWTNALQTHQGFVAALLSPFAQLEAEWTKVLGAMAADWEGKFLSKLGFNLPGVGGGSGAPGGAGGGLSGLAGLFGFGGGGGSGNAGGSTGSFNEAGDFVAESSTGAIGEATGDAAGGALSVGSSLISGIATAGIGAAVSIGLPMLVNGIKKLFGGPSQEEVQARATVSSFEDQLHGMLTAQQQLEAGNSSWKQTTIAVRDAYVATGHSEAEAEAAVKQLWDSSRQGAAATKAAIDQINGVLNEQKQDQQDLTAATQRYHFSIEELGPAMRKQQLTEQAVGLENDFRLLAGSGIDVKTVLDHMGGSINDFIHLAQKTGSEVPSEMQPMLQQMVDMGTLTDQNGNKITNLASSGLTFSETMTQGFDRIVQKLNDLLQGLGIGLPDAISKIPKSVDVGVHFNVDRPPGGGTEPGFASEAYVRSPTLAMIGDVAGGEFVLKPSTLKALGDRAFAAGAASASAPALDTSALEAQLAAMGSALQKQQRSIEQMMMTQPYLIRDAILHAASTQ